MRLLQLDELPWEDVSHDPRIKKRVFFRNGEVPHLTQFAQSRFEPGQSAPAHSHQDMVEVFLVTAGTATAIINGEVLELPAGSCLLVEVGDVHELRNDGGEEMRLTYFGLRAGTPAG